MSHDVGEEPTGLRTQLRNNVDKTGRFIKLEVCVIIIFDEMRQINMKFWRTWKLSFAVGPVLHLSLDFIYAGI